mgnify:CR=1 FL=1|tara:strand:+ start:369 stop:569 length:201 start_codon:yes stop_codon:yes gene_type:complete
MKVINKESKMKREEVVKLVEDCNKKLRELHKLYMNDFLDDEGDEIVENFFYEVRDLVEEDWASEDY